MVSRAPSCQFCIFRTFLSQAPLGARHRSLLRSSQSCGGSTRTCVRSVDLAAPMPAAPHSENDMEARPIVGEEELSLGDCDLRYIRTGTGPSVVLVHTLRTQLEYFLPLMRELGPGLDIIAPDLPGHGRSSAPDVEYTAAYFTDTIADFLEAFDLKRVVIVGESI